MKIINEGKKTIARFWRVPSTADVEYRPIRFHVKVNDGENALLLNTVTGELVLLSEEENEIFSNLPGRIPAGAISLITHRFVVPIDYDETKSVDQLRNICRKIEVGKNITGYSILPTTGCNARCFYCFESDYPKVPMSSETAIQTVEFIKNHYGGEKIWINWFGGEPMVGRQRISQICDLLMEAGIEYSSSMLSNGSLFTKELAMVAKKKWHLRRIQITLDGSEKIYNHVKSYVGLSGNPYYLVLDNIGYLLDEGIHVNVRLNMDFHNTEDIPIVIDELAARYGGRDNFYVYVNELFEDEGFEPVHHSAEERAEIEARRASLEEYIAKQDCRRGIPDKVTAGHLPSLRYRFCMADNPLNVMINPLGQIGKCEHYSFKHLVGDIYQDNVGFDKSALDYWLNPEMLDYCKGCALYPDCAKPKTCDGGNGCRAEVAHNRIRSVENNVRHVYQRMIHDKQKGG